MCCHSGTGRCSSTTTDVSPRTVWIQPPNSSALLTVADKLTSAHLVGQVQDDFLPHRTPHPVGEEMHLVHHHIRKSLQRRRIRVEHVAQHLGGHDHHRGVGIHRHVAGEQADPVVAVTRRQIGVLLVAQRLERRGVEAFPAGRQRQVHREFADDGLAGTRSARTPAHRGRFPAPHTPAAESRRAQTAVPQ